LVATTVTSGRRSPHGRYSRNIPAANQLRYALSPQASTAAMKIAHSAIEWIHPLGHEGIVAGFVSRN
jgi:hypothetical protein